MEIMEPKKLLVPRPELTGLIRRLEAATSRLEDMASASTETLQPNGNVAATAASTATAISPSPVTAPPPPAPPAAPPAPKADPIPESVEEFDTFITESVEKYVKLSEGIGGDLAEQVGIYVVNSKGFYIG